MINKTTSNQGIKITPEMMKNFNNIQCDCGGLMFEMGVIFKQISTLLSPSGQEEVYPLEVFICKSCGKVPTKFNIGGILPEEILAKNKIDLT